MECMNFAPIPELAPQLTASLDDSKPYPPEDSITICLVCQGTDLIIIGITLFAGDSREKRIRHNAKASPAV